MRSAGPLLAFLVVGAGSALAAEPAGMLEAPPLPEGRDPEAQKRIDAATVASPAGECGLDEKALLEKQRKEVLQNRFRELTESLVDDSLRQAEQYWYDQGDLLAARMKQKAAALATKTEARTAAERAAEARLDDKLLMNSACRGYASGETELCSKLEDSHFREMCRSFLMVRKHDWLGRARCTLAPPMMQPTCFFMLYDESAPCDQASGDARVVCDRIRSFLSGPVTACEPPLALVPCLANLMTRGMKQGRAICDAVSPVGARDDDAYRLLHLQCLAILDSDPSACPEDPPGLFGAERSMTSIADGFLRADDDGVRATVAATADTPGVCAVSATAVRGGRVVGGAAVAFEVRTREVTIRDTPVLGKGAGAPDPFRDELRLDTLCVPGVAWGDGPSVLPILPAVRTGALPPLPPAAPEQASRLVTGGP